MTVRLLSRPTFAPNSVFHGAIRIDAITPTEAPNTMRATRPLGTVRGSVIMKYRKMKISGDVRMIHQKCDPSIGIERPAEQ